ncbi:MAG: transporter [Comamonadaceae bacterium BICA1-1]|nr:MAG: transporter [Comamonadaceae bacterium BICA1-1]
MKTTAHRLSVLMLAAAAAVAFTGLAGCASTATQRSTGQYVDDTATTAKVKAAIFNDATLKLSEINVETFQGTVQLSGFVNSAADIQRAVTVVQGVSGVRSVKNDMRIK